MHLHWREYFRLLSIYLRPQSRQIAGLSALLLLGLTLQLINPQIIRYFIDSATHGGTENSLKVAALLFVLCALAQQTLNAAANYSAQRIGWLATNRLREDLSDHCLRLDMSFHNSMTSGAIIERVDGDVSRLFNFFSTLAIRLISSALLAIAILALLFREDWRLGIAFGALTSLSAFGLFRIRKLAEPHWVALREMESAFYGFLGEQLSNTEGIRSCGATTYVIQRFYTIIAKWLPLEVSARLYSAYMWMVSGGAFALGNIVTFSLGAYLFATETITIGTVFLIFNYAQMLQAPLESFGDHVAELPEISACITRINAIMRSQSNIVDGKEPPLSSRPAGVTFNQICFAYHPKRDVLRDVTFNLEPGEVAGVIGRTGSGKTSLARLLLRLYDAQSGTIRIGNRELQDIPIASLRDQVALVTQDVQLFEGSIRDNITFFNRMISDSEITHALENLGLSEWCNMRPGGLNALLHGDGESLSAGEAQLLALTRVFLRNPSIVILDEASSRLDTVSEYHLHIATRRLMKNRTGLIIAHRLSTLSFVDTILVLERGQVVEYGRESQLRNDPTSRYYLWRSLAQSGLIV